MVVGNSKGAYGKLLVQKILKEVFAWSKDIENDRLSSRVYA